MMLLVAYHQRKRPLCGFFVVLSLSQLSSFLTHKSFHKGFEAEDTCCVWSVSLRSLCIIAGRRRYDDHIGQHDVIEKECNDAVNANDRLEDSLCERHVFFFLVGHVPYSQFTSKQNVYHSLILRFCTTL